MSKITGLWVFGSIGVIMLNVQASLATIMGVDIIHTAIGRS
jgi:hypothetical protein